MNFSSKSTLMLFLIASVLFFSTQPTPANIDSIILKNGQTIESETCWEEGDMVKCKRYGATVGYQKNDIARIVKISEAEQHQKDRRLPQRYPLQPTNKEDLVDLYRLNIALKVQKEWVYEEQTSAPRHKRTIASIVFRVLPNGEVNNIVFTEESNDKALNESAYAAIEKAAPFPPLPDSYSRPYLEVGLRFTPRGLQ